MATMEVDLVLQRCAPFLPVILLVFAPHYLQANLYGLTTSLRSFIQAT